MNCELNHVDVVLCCDPKAFTHTNPLEGLKKGGCLVWESSDTPETAWQRIPAHHRKFVKDNNIRIYILPGFDIARKATDRGDLQLRMQGNSFLGAFFRVSPFLKHNDISDEPFLATVKKQYEKKFGRFGEAVVTSNMTGHGARLLARAGNQIRRLRRSRSFVHAQSAGPAASATCR